MDDSASPEPESDRGEQRWLRGLPPLPRSVRDARTFVGTALADTGHRDLLEDAEQAISEVVTNAVVHAGTVIDVTVWVGGSRVRVGVRDRSIRLPHTRDYAVTARTGRGMRLLDMVTTSWGVEAEEDGKTVWFDLGPKPPACGQGPGRRTTRRCSTRP